MPEQYELTPLAKSQECPIGYEKSHCLNCAFKAKCQDVGSEKKHTPECIKHKAIFGGVGCTCNGTGKAQMGEPDREKIKEIFFEAGCYRKLLDWGADQILTLFDTEAIKREEQERIVKIINKCKTDWFGDEDNPEWIQAVAFDIEDWQALKGE